MVMGSAPQALQYHPHLPITTF